MKRGKVTLTEGIELPSGDTIRDIDKEGYRYLGIFQFDSVRDNIMTRHFKASFSGDKDL